MMVGVIANYHSSYGAYKMKKINLLALLSTIGLVACSSCSGTPPQPSIESTSGCNDTVCSAPLPDAGTPTTPNVIVKDNCQFTLPDHNWSREALPGASVVEFLRNAEMDADVVLVKEQTPETFAEYVLIYVRGLDVGSTGGVLTSSEVTVNGNKFELVQVVQGGLVLLMWVTVKDGYGYILACGNDIDAGTPSVTLDLCKSIGETFQIK